MVQIIALVIILVILIIYIGIAAAILWHLFRYGIEGDHSKLLATIFLIVSIILIGAMFAAYANVDWTQLEQSINLEL